MYVVRLHIENYRGIKKLTWLPSRAINCLIGPGNSCKSTIVDALALLFTSRRSVPFSDADFHRCETDNPIRISAVIVELPIELRSFETYGHLQCGWDLEGQQLHSDPLDTDAPALAVRLTVDHTLDPLWEAYKPTDDGETRSLRAGTRENLGVFRVQERPDQHLRWSRGSALASLQSDGDAVTQALTDAHRIARDAVFNAPLEGLKTTATSVSSAASEIGAGNFKELRPGLDPRAISSGGALILHDGKVPLTSEGLGARRLTSIAIQKLRAEDHSVLLVDEVEHGLEPHRLLRVVRTLRDSASNGDQVIATTHSPTVVAAFDATDLVVVRADTDGNVEATAVPDQLAELDVEALRGTVRTGPEAMLATRVLVVEGATEEGFLRECTARWDTGDLSLALTGTAVRMGGSDEQALERSTCLAQLGYCAGAMLDFDKDLSDSVEAAKAAGVAVFRSPRGLDFEHHIVRDLPEHMLRSLIDLAVEIRAEFMDDTTARASVYEQVKSRIQNGEPDPTGDEPMAWVTQNRTVQVVRNAIADSASKGRWFKKQPAAARLATMLLDHKVDIHASNNKDDNFMLYLGELRRFLYATEPISSEASGDAATA